MRVLFLEFDTERQWGVASLGPAFLAAYLRRFGHDASLLRVAVDWDAALVLERIRVAAPALIGVSLTTRQWRRARDVLRRVRAAMDVPVVAGGLHPTFSPESVLAEPAFDYVCLGEGEAALLDLVQALEAGARAADVRIDNVWGKGGPRPALRRPFEPIDDLPWMARDLLDEHPGVVHMTTQRGCPFKCTYCAARMYDEMYADTGHYGRRRSHESVLAELLAIRARGPLHYVIFLDDTFTIHHPWVHEFCRVYQERLGVPFSLHARVETVSEKLLARLAAAGCKHITYGVESGSERIRRDVMRRPVSNRRFADVFRWTRDAGIFSTANYMLGLPGESPSEMRETLALHAELVPDDFAFSVFYPFPGTHLFRECLAQGLLPADYLDRPANHRESILALPAECREAVEECYAEWTRVRAAHSVQRSGQQLSVAGRESAIRQVEHCASTG